MNGAARALPPHIRERLASALESGLLACGSPSAAVHSVVGDSSLETAVTEVLSQFANLGISGVASAAWLRTIDAELTSMPRPDLVWSGPRAPGVPARDTRRVYEEILGSAKESLWVSTYAFFEGPKAFATLAVRMATVPTLQVTLLLNIQRRRGDTSATDDIVRRFADRFWKAEWPAARKPRVFYDPRALELDGPGGVLHAKAVIADGARVFITSANFTEAAWDRNIELGMMIADSALAQSITAHFGALIEQHHLRALPAG